jgi:hypothetical protein
MEHEDSLARFALEISVDESSPLSLSLGEFQGQISLFFRISHGLPWFLVFP